MILAKNMNDKPVNIRKIDVMADIFEGKGKLDGDELRIITKGREEWRRDQKNREERGLFTCRKDMGMEAGGPAENDET